MVASPRTEIYREQVQMESVNDALQPTAGWVTVQDPGLLLSACMHVPPFEEQTDVHVCAVCDAWTKRQVVGVSPQAK